MNRKSAFKQLINNPSNGGYSFTTAADTYMQTGLGGGEAGKSQAYRDAKLARLRQDPEYVAKERLAKIGSFRLNQYNRPSTEDTESTSQYMRDIAGYNQDTGVTVYNQQRSDNPEFNVSGLAYNNLAGGINNPPLLGQPSDVLNDQSNVTNNLFSNQAVDNMFSTTPETRLEDTMMT